MSKKKQKRILITGGPNTGKTTKAKKTGLPRKHTDKLIGKGWSKSSDEVKRWIDTPGPVVIEGAAAVRGLRKWLKANPKGKPVDEVHLQKKTYQKTTKGQQAMAKGVDTIFQGIEKDLKKRGVKIKKQ